MAGTKKKSSKGKAPSKQSKQQQKPSPTQAYLEQQQALAPLDRMVAVRPLWQSLTPEEREAALTVPLEDLRAYAKELAARNRLASEAEMAEAAAAGQIILTFDPSLDEVLEQGLERSKECGTWKIWNWPPDKAEFKDTEAFRKHMEDHLLGPEHRAVLPKEPEGSRPLEQPNEAAFRKRMQELLVSVQEQRLAQDEEVAAASRRPGTRRQDPYVVMRDATIELIIMILSALEREHESLYHHCLVPVTSYVCDVLPEGSYKTTRTELYPEDLENLLPEDIQRMFEFLQEKLDTLSTRLKPDAAELELEDPEEEPIGDVDLFSLTPDGTALCVNDKWMSHLRSRVLGEDSQPRQAKDGEDPTKAGLALEWVYGTIVSTAEKGRDAAHRMIGTKPVSPEEAVESLVNALEEQALWEQHARSSRELLSQMLASRKEAAEMGEKYDLRTKNASSTAANGSIAKPASSSASDETTTAADGGASAGVAPAATATTEELPTLPPHVILFLLKREALLTAAKLHGLKLEQVTAKRELRSYQAQLRAGEPRFERLRRELDEMKNAPSRSLDGTYRNTADMERHRSQLADAAIEEQITAQAEFRKIGSRLQKIVDLKGEIEMQISRRDQEANQLQLWRRNICQMVDSLEDNIAASAPLESLLLADGADDEVDEEAGEINDAKRALVAAVKVATRHAEELENLRNSFNNTFRRELYVPADDIAIFETVQKQLKEIERRLDEGKVAIQHLLQFAINVACDDPGCTIGQSIVLPYLQEKLDLRGLEWANEKAAAAQEEVIRMESELEDKQRVEKEKKAKAKAKAKEKARTEKERERADREAKERLAREAEEEAKRHVEAAAEEARKKRAAELEALRLAEEELMEKRRKELLADEDSHWRQRQQQDDELRHAQAALEKQLAQEEATSSGSPSSGAGGKGKDDGFIAAGASNNSKRNANRRGGAGKDSSGKEKEQQQQDRGEQQRRNRDSSSSAGQKAMANGREKAPKAAETPATPAPVATPTPTLADPAVVNGVPAIAITIAALPNGVAAAAAAAATGAGGSPLAPSSPDRVESTQPVAVQPEEIHNQLVNAGSATPSAPLSPQQMLPVPAAAAMVPLPPPPPGAMMPMPLPPPGMVTVPVPIGMSPPGTVVGLPPVPAAMAVLPQPPPVLAPLPGVPLPVVPSHSRSGSGFSGAEELHSPTTLPHGPLPTPPPPPPPRPSQQQQNMYPGGPHPMSVYNGGPPPPHPNMFYGPPNGEPLPPHMMRGPGGPPPMGYVVPPPPPPPPPGSAAAAAAAAAAGAPPHHHQGGPGMMHPPVHPYHMQHGPGMMPPPPHGVAMGQPFPGPPHGGGRSYQQYHGGPPPNNNRQQHGGSSSFAASFASRQLRAAAQPFVPSSNTFSMPESGGDDGAANGGGGESGNAAAPESKSNKVQQGGITDGEEASPRGILEPAQLSNSASQAGGPVTTSHGTASSTAGDEAASEEAGSTISDGITGIGSGAFEAGQQEQMLAMVGNGKTAAQASAPAAVPQPPVVDLKKLKSVRGLSNSPGVYNCFLNVIIQSLWHLPAFRKALLSLTPAELKKHTADNTEVLTSLRAIFEELNQSHSSNGAENDVDDSVPLKPVSPQQLREALGGSRFDHGNMHDAAEVLGELFDRLHVAEVGTQGRDPTLPRTVRVDAASIQNAAKKPRTTKGAATADGSSPLASVVAKDSVWGNAAALKMVKKALALADAEASNAGNKSNGSGGEQKDAVSMVQKLFGMEVQAPVHNTNNTNSTNSTSNGGKGGKSKGGNKNSSSSSAVTATVEVIQFTRYFHLVPAQGLRIAASTAPSFEDALVAATAGGNTPPTERLLTKPSVFTLSTVFESPQVPAPALAATLAALRPELDISRLFLNTPSLNADGDEDEENDAAGDGFKYKLRCMVCYSSSHYFAFAFNEEVGQWLLLDDAHVSAVGQWKDVQATAAQRRLQPSLLFYEAVAAQ